MIRGQVVSTINDQVQTIVLVAVEMERVDVHAVRVVTKSINIILIAPCHLTIEQIPSLNPMVRTIPGLVPVYGHAQPVFNGDGTVG